MILEQIVTNPYFAIGGFLFGGILCSIVTYFITKKNKKPCYIIKNHYFIRDLSSKINDLKVCYNKEQIENLTISKVGFWNAGTEIIRQEDIANVDPITINVEEGYKILRPTKIVYVENSANGFFIEEIDDRSITLNFNYIGKNEGVIIQIFHTAISNEGIKLNGSIIGASKINNHNETKEWIFIPIGFFILALSIAFPLINFFYYDMIHIKPIHLYIVLILTVITLIIILFSNRPPKNFRYILSQE